MSQNKNEFEKVQQEKQKLVDKKIELIEKLAKKKTVYQSLFDQPIYPELERIQYQIDTLQIQQDHWFQLFLNDFKTSSILVPEKDWLNYSFYSKSLVS